MRSAARKSGQGQRRVGEHDPHQRDAGEVVALRHHLRPHQHVHLAVGEAGEERGHVSGRAHGVAVEARHARGGQELADGALHLLGADADAAPRATAGRAGGRHPLLLPAVVAEQHAPAACGR